MFGQEAKSSLGGDIEKVREDQGRIETESQGLYFFKWSKKLTTFAYQERRLKETYSWRENKLSKLQRLKSKLNWALNCDMKSAR